MKPSMNAWRFSRGLLLCSALVAGGFFLGYRAGCETSQRGPDDRLVVTESYPVSDLVTPWNPAENSIEENFSSLLGEVQRHVLPNTWDAMRRVHADEESLSLVVAQTKAGHAEVEGLLKAFRSLHVRYKENIASGVCGHCGESALPAVGEQCSGCTIARHDPPAA